MPHASFADAHAQPISSTPHRHNRAAVPADNPNPPLKRTESQGRSLLLRCTTRPDGRAAVRRFHRRTTIDDGTRMPAGGLAAATQETRASGARPSGNKAAIETAAAPG